jgi:hypothetical protein
MVGGLENNELERTWKQSEENQVETSEDSRWHGQDSNRAPPNTSQKRWCLSHITRSLGTETLLGLKQPPIQQHRARGSVVG